MSTRVKFIKGSGASYSASKYPGAIYFATDEQKIYVDGVAYSGSQIDDTRIVSAITWNDGKLFIQYLDGTSIAMDPKIPEATTTTAGLKSAAFAETTAFDAAGSAASVLGDEEDNAEANTVYGAKAYADQIANNAVSNALTGIEFA